MNYCKLWKNIEYEFADIDNCNESVYWYNVSVVVPNKYILVPSVLNEIELGNSSSELTSNSTPEKTAVVISHAVDNAS
jgi:hypothetical protein